jgi:RNA polymerase sigma factor (sigma-70 family)
MSRRFPAASPRENSMGDKSASENSTKRHAPSEPDLDRTSDTDLAQQVRDGHTDSYAALYLRYRDWALGRALWDTDRTDDAEDIAAEAFAVVFDSLLRGKGPTQGFRPYLGAVIRNLAYARNRAGSRNIATDDNDVLDSAFLPNDATVDLFENRAVRDAYFSLPGRWRAVLRCRVIMQKTASETADLLGVSANAVSSLTNRATEALTQAYLQEHIAPGGGLDCHPYVQLLSAYQRSTRRPATLTKVAAHLATCPCCTAMLEEIRHWSPSRTLPAGGLKRPGTPISANQREDRIT